MSPATYAAVVHASMSCDRAEVRRRIAARLDDMFIVTVRTLLTSAAFAVFVFVRVLFAVRDVAVHVDSAVEVAVRLLHHRLAEHLARVAERDGKSAFVLHYLGHRVAATEVAHRSRNGQRSKGGDCEDCRAAPHRRLLRRKNEERARSATMYASA